MPEATERDILIEVRTKVEALHGELLGAPGREGRIPQLESTVDEHAEKINTFRGSISTLVWVIGGVGLLAVTLAGVVMAHVLGGK